MSIIMLERVHKRELIIRSMAGNQYKLVYFNFRARAEVIRFVFHASGVRFEDQRVDMKDWPSLKPSIPTHRLPYLEITASNGSKKGYEESMAIARHLAHTHRMMGDNESQYYKIERIIGQSSELDEQFYKIFFSPNKEEGEKLKAAFKTEKGPTILQLITRSLNESGGKFVAGPKVTLGDLYLMTVMDHVSDLDPDMLNQYPIIQQHRQDVLQAIPQLKSYIDSRPRTPM